MVLLVVVLLIVVMLVLVGLDMLVTGLNGVAHGGDDRVDASCLGAVRADAGCVMMNVVVLVEVILVVMVMVMVVLVVKVLVV